MNKTLASSLSPATRDALLQMLKLTESYPPIELGGEQVEDWEALAAMIEEMAIPRMDVIVKATGVDWKWDNIAGVPVIRITPPTVRHPGRKLLYAHGGGYTVMSARSALAFPSMVACCAETEVISVDYSLAPRAGWRVVTAQLADVFRALLDDGIEAGAIGIFGDSAGGGLTIGGTLRLRDEASPLPGALFVSSPWVDLALGGDTAITLRDADLTLAAERIRAGGRAYAAVEEQRHPYASPVFGDYTKPFPPTLIQAGGRELLLSDAIRLYQAMRTAGRTAELDIYEGMPHVHPVVLPDIEETQTAISRASEFFDSHLSR